MTLTLGSVLCSLGDSTTKPIRKQYCSDSLDISNYLNGSKKATNSSTPQKAYCAEKTDDNKDYDDLIKYHREHNNKPFTTVVKTSKDGRTQKVVESYAYGDTVHSFEATYKYDEKGRKIERDAKGLGEDKGRKERDTYEYYDNGNYKKQTWDITQKDGVRFKFIKEYDENGNCIMHIEKYNPKTRKWEPKDEPQTYTPNNK